MVKKWLSKALLGIGLLAGTLGVSQNVSAASTQNKSQFDFYFCTTACEGSSYITDESRHEGYGVRFTINTDGTLTISGNGKWSYADVTSEGFAYYSPQINDKLGKVTKCRAKTINDVINYYSSIGGDYCKVTRIVYSTGSTVDCSGVESFEGFFSNLTQCTRIDAGLFETAEKCKSYLNLVNGCTSLEYFDMSKINTDNVKETNLMQMGTCNNVTEIVTPTGYMCLPMKSSYFWVDESNNTYTGGSIVKGSHVMKAMSVNKYLTLNLNGGWFDKSQNVDLSYNAINGMTSIPTPAERTGYVFKGWYNGNTKVTSIAPMDANNYTLDAKWEKVTYTITYHLDGGTNDKWNVSTYTAEDALTFNSPTKAGYSFNGWYLNEQMTWQAKTYYKAGTYTQDLDLYAKWTVNTYGITYELGDKKAYLNSATVYSFTINDSVKLGKPTLSGYTFIGWYTNPEKTKAITEIPVGTQSNITVYAKWEYTPIYKAKNQKVSGVKLNKKGKKLTISWKKVKGCTYQVKVSKKANMKGAKTYTVKGTKLTLKKIKGKRYVQIRTQKVVNEKKYSGVWTKVKSK